MYWEKRKDINKYKLAQLNKDTFVELIRNKQLSRNTEANRSA